MKERKIAYKAIIVARKSTPGQKSEEWQLDAMDKYVKSEGLEILDTILVSESGWQRNRKEFTKAVKKLELLYDEHNEPIALVVWEEDRLTRRFGLRGGPEHTACAGLAHRL